MEVVISVHTYPNVIRTLVVVATIHSQVKGGPVHMQNRTPPPDGTSVRHAKVVLLLQSESEITCIQEAGAVKLQ